MTTPPPPPLSDRDRALLRRRARQLRKAHDSLGRGNRRITPEVRRIVEDLARSAEAMGLTALTRSAQGSLDTTMGELWVAVGMLLETLDTVLAEPTTPAVPGGAQDQ